jgi:hypothetical protein
VDLHPSSAGGEQVKRHPSFSHSRFRKQARLVGLARARHPTLSGPG